MQEFPADRLRGTRSQRSRGHIPGLLCGTRMEISYDIFGYKWLMAGRPFQSRCY